MTIHNVWILLKSGICLFHKEYHSVKLDEDLVSGFLSAASSFVTKLGEDRVESIVMGKKKFVCISSEDLIFSLCVDKEDDEKQAIEKLWEIKVNFLRKYLQKIKGWNGDVKVYEEFEEDLNKIVYEKVRISVAVKELLHKLQEQKNKIGE
ncbi:MAG: hypothetical protein QXS27_03275 [Candidatus Jordarchaeaceae archaeon]